MGKTYRRSNDDYGSSYGRPKSLREKRQYGNKVRKGWSNVSDYDDAPREYQSRKQMPAEDRGEW
jgi:hypothetical protein